ncbi:MAG: hypothetical protein NVS1B10_08040 [Candidatus Saccharimonadales bacterium]
MTIPERIQELNQEIEWKLPELLQVGESTADVVILHQDAFAADYTLGEYILLGQAIKYLGLTGKEVRVLGKNRETLDGEGGNIQVIKRGES